MKKYTSAVRSTKQDFDHNSALQAACDTSIARAYIYSTATSSTTDYCCELTHKTSSSSPPPVSVSLLSHSASPQTYLAFRDQVPREASEAAEGAVQYKPAQVAVGVAAGVEESGRRPHASPPQEVPVRHPWPDEIRRRRIKQERNESNSKFNTSQQSQKHKISKLRAWASARRKNEHTHFLFPLILGEQLFFFFWSASKAFSTSFSLRDSQDTDTTNDASHLPPSERNRQASGIVTPFRAPKPLPILIPSNFVPKNGSSCNGVKGNKKVMHISLLQKGIVRGQPLLPPLEPQNLSLY